MDPKFQILSRVREPEVYLNRFARNLGERLILSGFDCTIHCLNLHGDQGLGLRVPQLLDYTNVLQGLAG